MDGRKYLKGKFKLSKRLLSAQLVLVTSALFILLNPSFVEANASTVIVTLLGGSIILTALVTNLLKDADKSIK
jgi:hypothetical protein